jgi:hypothetical protein
MAKKKLNQVDPGTPTLSQIFGHANPTTGKLFRAPLSDLVAQITTQTPVKSYANEAALLANTDLVIGYIAYVADSGSFYLYQGPTPGTIGNYTLFGGTTLTDGNGTTANGSAADLGGAITIPVILILTGPDNEFRLEGDTANLFARFLLSQDSNGDSILSLQTAEFILAVDPAGINGTPGLVFYDSRAVKKGIEYAADYSADYTNRSLVDKEYVDNNVGGAGTVTSIAPTTNRITVDNTNPAVPVINIDAAYDAAITAAINAKVTQTITNGITTTAPSEDAVFDALALKAPLASPTFTGVPSGPTAAPGTNTTQLATTAFVDALGAELGDLNVDQITGAVSLVSADLGTLWELSGTTTDYTVDLPTAVGNAEKTIIFKGLAALTKNVTISGISGQTIDGVTTRVVGGGGSLTLLSDGANWAIINEIGSWVNYTPVWSGFSSDPTVGRAVYFRVGKMCTVHLNATANGTSNATSMTVTLPFASKFHNPQPALVVNNGATGTSFGRVDPLTSSSVANCYTSAGAAAWTASGGKRISFCITYEVE